MISYNSEKYWKIFVYNLIELRKQHNLSKRKMAEICGTNVETLSQIEKGELPDELSVEIIIKLCNHFNIKPTSLFEEELKIR